MAERFDLHQTVTDTIVAAIERGGELPWIRPWGTGGIDRRGPRNGVSGRRYRGVNAILLAIAGAAYGSDEWYTFNGARGLGGSVRKGERGTTVVYWTIVKKTVDGEEDSFPILRYFKVFNRGQIDGLPEPKAVPAPSSFDAHAEADVMIRATGATIHHGGDRAFYRPLMDDISLPEPGAFVDPASYYSTAFHELVHWTGHPSRLGRKFGAFGSPDYAKEELVAELGAAFLCAEYSIDGKTQHPEYIANWLKVLKGDKRFIFQASSLASKAVALLSPEEVEEEAGEEAAA